MSGPTPSTVPATGPATDHALAAAVRAVDVAIDAPHDAGAVLDRWRSLVQRRLDALRAVLAAEDDPVDDAWLAARSSVLLHERDALVARASDLLGVAPGSPDVEGLRAQLRRFLTEVTHHLQRRHDLAYDAVELELGGSE